MDCPVNQATDPKEQCARRKEMNSWHRLPQLIAYRFRLILHRQKSLACCFLLERLICPAKCLIKVRSILEDRTGNGDIGDFRILVKQREIPFDVGRYGPLLDAQKVVSHHDGSVEAGELYVCKVKNARFDTRTGIICTSDNALLVESAVDLRRLKKSSTYLDRIPHEAEIVRLPGTYSSIHGMWQQNYFHWMIESLPRLYSLKLWGKPLRLLTPHTLTPLQRETLEACLPGNAELHFFDGVNTWLQVDEFVFPSFPVRKHFPILPLEYIEYVRNRIFGHFGLSDIPYGDKRIYVSRMKAQHSKPLNEAKVIELLGKYGFRPFCLEDLSFEDQVRLFHQASIVVAPHGAGLTNLIFAGKIKVIELLTRSIPPTFFFLSHTMSQEYFYLFPIEFEVGAIPDPYVQSSRYASLRKSNYTVNLEQLDALMRDIDD